MENKDLLVISHSYSTFTKEQIEELSTYFNSIHVLVRYNPLAEVGKYFPGSRFDPFTRDAKIDDRDIPDNVQVNTTSLLYLPTNNGYRRLGERHFQKVKGQVDPSNFDLVHGHFTWTAGYVATEVSSEYGIPSVVTVHANRDRFMDEYTSGHKQIHSTWRNADAVIRVNERDVPKLAEYSDNVYSIPNGYSRDRFRYLPEEEARTQLGIASNVKLIFSLGLLIERKGFHYLIDAVDRLRSAGEEVLCAIGGHGSQRKELEKKISELGLEEHVRLLGFVPEEELDLWMNACDVFSLASSAEGNPTVMFEALGCGKPYVGTAVGGVGEIIQEGRYGFTCDPGNADELAEILERGLHYDWNRAEILEYGEQFTWSKIVKRIVSVYQDVLND